MSGDETEVNKKIAIQGMEEYCGYYENGAPNAGFVLIEPGEPGMRNVPAKTTREKVVTETVYQTTDGRSFKEFSVAQAHQDIVDGKKKTCPECDGRGAVRKYDSQRWYHTGHRQPNGDPIISNYVCNSCNGTRVVDVNYRGGSSKELEWSSGFDKFIR